MSLIKHPGKFTKKVERECSKLIKKQIENQEISKIIQSSISLIQEGKQLNPENLKLSKKIDLFTYFNMLNYFLKEQESNLAKKAHYIALNIYSEIGRNYKEVYLRLYSKFNNLWFRRSC